MITHIEAVLGIAISLFLFYISYRQTIGASKERAQAANAEINSAVFKRTVLNGLSVTPPMIRQLVEGKALLHNVRVSDLHSVEEILSILFATTLESDFVPEEKRATMLQMIVGLSASSERGAAKEVEAIAAETTEAWQKRTELVMILMAVVASLLGGLSSILPRLGKVSGQFFNFADKQVLYRGVLVTALSLVLLLVNLWILRFRESEKQAGRPIEARSRGSIERDVLKILQQFHIPTSLTGPESAYDFDAEISGKKTLIEVKNWPRRVPSSLIRMTIRRMKSLVDSGKGAQSLVVTKEPIAFPELGSIDPRVKLIALNDLRNYLVHEAASK